MSFHRFLSGLLMTTALATAGAAHAQDQAGARAAATGVAEGLAENGDAVLALDELEALAGGDGVEINMITAQTLTAINTGNSVTGQTIGSGQVNLGADAFSGFDGIGNFVINTGHNNNLQSSLNVNIVLAP